MIRRIIPTRSASCILRSHDGQRRAGGVCNVPRSGECGSDSRRMFARPTTSRIAGYGFSDAPAWALSWNNIAHATIVDEGGECRHVRTYWATYRSIEAIESDQLGSQVRRLVVVGMPLFTDESSNDSSRNTGESL